MKYKGALLFWTAVLLAIELSLLIATGIIMYWVLPPGTGGRMGGHRRRELLEMTRHDFGDIHFWIAVAMVVTVVIHVALNWGWTKSAALRYLTFGLTARRRGARPA